MKNKFSKRFWIISFVITVFASFIIGYSPINATNQPQTSTATKVTTACENYTASPAAPLDIVKTPQKYLNKYVTFKAKFDKFSALGLDYKPAMMSSQDYIGILIKRDDVTDHTIPLSEMKLFLKRSEAEKYIDLSSGDSIELDGKVFSNALGDPWIEIKKFTVLSQAKKACTK